MFTFCASLLKPVLVPLVSRKWIHGERIPAAGGCIIALNHISHLDPLMSAHFVYDHGRFPRYLAKSGLFRNKALAAILNGVRQIPVERLSADAVGAFDAAVEAINNGECVVIYPEGTLTRDPDLWPMRGKSGAARIALETGCPVYPVGQWGAHELLYPYAKRLDWWPRKQVTMKVGRPVDLADLVDVGATPDTVALATDRIMAAITQLVADVRGEVAPEVRFDPKAAGVRETGNPKNESEC